MGGILSTGKKYKQTKQIMFIRGNIIITAYEEDENGIPIDPVQQITPQQEVSIIHAMELCNNVEIDADVDNIYVSNDIRRIYNIKKIK